MLYRLRLAITQCSVMLGSVCGAVEDTQIIIGNRLELDPIFIATG